MDRGFESAVGRACARWIAAVDRRPGRVLAALLAVTAGLGLYAARHLGIDADTRALINQRLPFQVRQRELTETFHTLGDGILVVIDADSPAAAHRAADALAARLEAQSDLFTQVDIPGGGPFFERNALLYLTPAQLEDLTDRLSALQPFLAELARDQSLVGIADLLAQALAAERDGTLVGLDLATALDRISTAVEATTAGHRAPDPWGTALLGGALPAEARRRVVELRPRLDYGTLLNAAPHVRAIREAVRALHLDDPERGITVRITGEPVLNFEELIAVGTQSRKVAVVSFVLFTATVCFALRSVRVILALVGCLLASLVWSNAFAAATVGNLNQISAAFNVLIIGLGGEFGIHFCMRYAELLSAGRTRYAALTETGATIGSSLFSSAGTTSIGFLVFTLTDFTGVAQLGLISGVGMFLSLASTLTVLPALLAVGAAPAPGGQPAARPWITRLEHLPLRYARPIRMAAAGLALAAVCLLPRVRFDHNLLNLRDPSTESVATFEDLLAQRGSSPWSIDVVAPDLPTARVTAGALAALPVVEHARTLADYVPDEQEEKLEILETASYFVPPAITAGPRRSEAVQRAALERLIQEAARTGNGAGGGSLVASAHRLQGALRTFLRDAAGDGRAAGALDRLQTNIIGSLPEQLGELSRLLSPGRVTAADLPADLTRRMLAADGRARIEVFPREEVSESAALLRFVDTVRERAPDAAGTAVWLVEWGRVTWEAMLWALLGGMVCMVLFLVLLWRRVWDSILAFFPLVLAALLTCAALVVLGQPFNFANVIVLPMLIGMGVDNGVHLVHRHRTNPEEVDVLATSTARAVFYAALTTMLSFGSLAFATHRGIAAIGQLLTVGVALTLVCYVVVLPAVLEWDDRRRRRSESGTRSAGRRASG
jgi:hopanoid biosynthesis associated RND transporter like protein HpnN